MKRIRPLLIALAIIATNISAAKAETEVVNLCTVRDRSGTPLNVRATPNGQKVGTLSNGTEVIIATEKKDEQGRLWAYISDGQEMLGWVIRTHIYCPNN